MQIIDSEIIGLLFNCGRLQKATHFHGFELTLAARNIQRDPYKAIKYCRMVFLTDYK